MQWDEATERKKNYFRFALVARRPSGPPKSHPDARSKVCSIRESAFADRPEALSMLTFPSPASFFPPFRKARLTRMPRVDKRHVISCSICLYRRWYPSVLGELLEKSVISAILTGRWGAAAAYCETRGTISTCSNSYVHGITGRSFRSAKFDQTGSFNWAESGNA